MSRLARYIESSSDESSIEDKYDSTSFGSQFDSDSSSDSDEDSRKFGYVYESDQESHISLTPGEEYVLDTLFGWMDRPMCAAQERQSLLLESARASALQNIKVNRQMYLTNHAENPENESDSDSDSFITQEAEEYSEGPEQSYSEAQDAPPTRSKKFTKHDAEEDEDSEIEYEEVKPKAKPSKLRKYARKERKVAPVAVPVSTEEDDDEIDLFHSESQDDDSESEDMVELPSASDDETSAAHRESFLKTVMKKKERKVKGEGVPSSIFEPPSKKKSNAAKKMVPTEVKLSENKAVGIPPNVNVMSSSKNTRRKSAEAPEEMMTELSVEVPLEVSIATGTESVTDVPSEIQTSPEGYTHSRGRSRSRPSPVNADYLSDEMGDLEVETKPSLETLAAKIAKQQNTPRNRSNRDPTPTRREARNMRQQDPEVEPQTNKEADEEGEVVDLTASKEPPVGYSPQSPHVNKAKDEQIQEPRRNSPPDPAEGSEAIAHSSSPASKEQPVVLKAKTEIKATRAKRLSSAKKQKRKKKVADIHPGQPKQEGEVADLTQQDTRPVKSVTVEELKTTLSELSHPHPQQMQSKDNEESKHKRAPSMELVEAEQLYMQTQSQHFEHQVVSQEEVSAVRENEHLARSIEERPEPHKVESRSAPVPDSPTKKRPEASRVSQNVIQYSPLPTNNQDNPIDIEEYIAQREMLNREAPRMDFSGSTHIKTAESPIAVREQAESTRQPPSPRAIRRRPEVDLEQHRAASDLPTFSNSHPYGKLPKKKSNYYFGAESSRERNDQHKFGIRQPKQFDALARNDPAGHMTNHKYDTKKKSKKSSSGKSKSNLASIEDLKKLEKRIEEHFRNSYSADNDNHSAVTTKELRMLERQLVLQLRRVEEKRAAKLERLRNKKKSGRRQRDIVEAEVIAVEPKDEGMHHHYSKKKSADHRDANRYEQLQALRLSKEMGRYMSKQAGHAAATRYQGQAY